MELQPWVVLFSPWRPPTVKCITTRALDVPGVRFISVRVVRRDPSKATPQGDLFGAIWTKGSDNTKNANFADGNLPPVSSVGAVYVAVCRGRAYQSQTIQGALKILEVCRRGKAHLAPNLIPDPF